MCGILAIARSTPARNGGPVIGPETLERAMARLRWRGPDGEGVYQSSDRRVLLGHTRLAIQDLSDAGRQPMADRENDERVVITYNGEIYNAPALRRELEREGFEFRSHTDTEVLVHGFIRWGIDGLLDRVRGMFAFVILDQREAGSPVLHAAVDPAGMKPLI
jgi:asparagine synthase (glutamine-hydrolysing)